MEKIDFDKIGVIASYLADNINNLYVTKLFKLFYYLDFISYKARGSSITNDQYYKLPYGPVPTIIKNDIDMMSRNIMEKSFKSQLSKYIKLEKNSDNNGNLVVNINHRYNLNKISDYDKDLLDKLIKTFKNTSAKAISNKTHKEKPWRLSSFNSVIDYHLANELNVDNILK